MDFLNCVGIHIIVLLSLTVSSCVSVICYMQPDGIYEQNCKAYTMCKEGEEIIIQCGPDQAFNTETKLCDNKWKVPPPCGTYRDCADRNDKNYADLETKCSSYYTCANSYFFGHSLCPSGLVFNEDKQVCDFKFAVVPPCGTLNLTHV